MGQIRCHMSSLEATGTDLEEVDSVVAGLAVAGSEEEGSEEEGLVEVGLVEVGSEEEEASDTL